MKIGIYTTQPPPEIGGGFTFENEVLEGILDVGTKTTHELVVFSPNLSWPARLPANIVHRCTIPSRSLAPNLIQRAIAKVGTSFKNSASQRYDEENWLGELAEKSGIEILFNLVPWKTLTMDVPYVNIVWDLMHRSHPFFPEVSQGRIWDGRERQYATLLRRAAAVIVGTQAGKREVEYFYQVSPERIRCLPHPTPRFALEAPVSPMVDVLTKYDLEGGYLLYPAQFWPHKNHVNLLLAIRHLRDQQGIRTTAVFVGSDRGNLAHVRSWIDKLGLNEEIKILGFIPREDLISLYQSAGILTYVSFTGPENFPPLEAFALGCPVLAARVAGAEEQLGEAATLVEPNLPVSIASGIQKILSSATLRDELIRRGHQRARRFTTQDFCRELFKILEELEPIRRSWGHGAKY